MSIFERASRHKYRFHAGRGSCTTEDLWDLDLEMLDRIYKGLREQSRELQSDQEDSLIQEARKDDRATEDRLNLEGKIEVVKHIFTRKNEWASRAAKAKETRERKQHLLQLLSNKKDEELQGKSAEEIQKMIDEME